MSNQPCPFCPLMGIDESLYNTVGNDFYGEPAMIGNIPACGPCAAVAEVTDTTEELLGLLDEAQRQGETA